MLGVVMATFRPFVLNQMLLYQLSAFECGICFVLLEERVLEWGSIGAAGGGGIGNAPPEMEKMLQKIGISKGSIFSNNFTKNI